MQDRFSLSFIRYSIVFFGIEYTLFVYINNFLKTSGTPPFGFVLGLLFTTFVPILVFLLHIHAKKFRMDYCGSLECQRLRTVSTL